MYRSSIRTLALLVAQLTYLRGQHPARTSELAQGTAGGAGRDALQALVKVLRAAEEQFEGVTLPPALRDLRIHAPVRGAWAKRLEFTARDIFGPKEGEGLDDDAKAALTEKYKNLVVQTVQSGGSVGAGKKSGPFHGSVPVEGRRTLNGATRRAGLHCSTGSSTRCGVTYSDVNSGAGS
jgi:hypothetical protein